MNQKEFWVAFNKVPGIGSTRLARLIETCGSVEAAWKAPIQELRSVGLDKRSLENLLEARRTINPAAEVEKVEKAGINMLTWDDANYPANLRQLETRPPLLYARGQMIEEDEWAVAIVGTRRASAYGREVAHKLATELAHNKITVISGLALGVDAIAHRAALDAGGRTIAVLGSGVDQLYPAQNRKLALEMLKRGAVVSEYPVGTLPAASNFPPRNRIISGLSRGVIIVEAGKKSGALITANYAAEQGREVFAVPGSILHPGSSGCNALIQSGATPLLSIDDVLDSLNLKRLGDKEEARTAIASDPLENQLLNHLSLEPRTVDDIVRSVEMSSAQVSSLLTIMELKGLVRQTNPLSYVRA